MGKSQKGRMDEDYHTLTNETEAKRVALEKLNDASQAYLKAISTYAYSPLPSFIPDMISNTTRHFFAFFCFPFLLLCVCVCLGVCVMFVVVCIILVILVLVVHPNSFTLAQKHASF